MGGTTYPDEKGDYRLPVEYTEMAQRGQFRENPNEQPQQSPQFNDNARRPSSRHSAASSKLTHSSRTSSGRFATTKTVTIVSPAAADSQRKSDKNLGVIPVNSYTLERIRMTKRGFGGVNVDGKSFSPKSEGGSKEAKLLEQYREQLMIDANDPKLSEEYRMLRLRDPVLRVLKFIPCVGVLLALVICGLITYFGVKNMPNNKYCLVLDDQFDSFDQSIWSHEIQLGGYGNSEFEWTTNNRSNSYVKDGYLHLVPTLSEYTFGYDAIFNNYTLDLNSSSVLGIDQVNADGSVLCTSSDIWSNCIRTSNSKNYSVIPPIQSVRLTTKNSVSITYGKIEIRARLPQGDWLWPAIWMMPRDSKYGEWPGSGEIDIVESRGNKRGYAQGGREAASSTIHWGPDSSLDRYQDTSETKTRQHDTFADDFHTFGLEWTPEYLETWIDSPLNTNLYIKFDQNSDMWTRGNFPASFDNGSAIHNIWGLHKNGNETYGNKPSTPFDQAFYLILNVAVGGTNGYFKDGKSNKPWVDSSSAAAYDFIKAKDDWYSTWPSDERKGMSVDYVKMWKLCN